MIQEPSYSRIYSEGTTAELSEYDGNYFYLFNGGELIMNE
jgi:hypothetical protein